MRKINVSLSSSRVRYLLFMNFLFVVGKMQIVTHYQQNAAYVQLLLNCDKVDSSQLFGKTDIKTLNSITAHWYHINATAYHNMQKKKKKGFNLKIANFIFCSTIFRDARILFDRHIWCDLWWQWGHLDAECHLWENAGRKVYQR